LSIDLGNFEEENSVSEQLNNEEELDIKDTEKSLEIP
jgi:hypothetical protein